MHSVRFFPTKMYPEKSNSRCKNIKIGKKDKINYFCYLDTGKTRSDVEKERFMINQEKDRPGAVRRSIEYNIIPTWDQVHDEFVKTYPDEEIIFDKENVQSSMQSMYNKTIDRLLLRPEINMFVTHLMDIHGYIELELITKAQCGILLMIFL